ncbi:hypothetical protein GQ53DRAFT_752845 [Thozetella sp. PMI_491]|nr:hypothetical protein GQ53DRAFT_752845 [Thozetella sp. PMI_491]
MAMHIHASQVVHTTTAVVAGTTTATAPRPTAQLSLPMVRCAMLPNFPLQPVLQHPAQLQGAQSSSPSASGSHPPVPSSPSLPQPHDVKTGLRMQRANSTGARNRHLLPRPCTWPNA